MIIAQIMQLSITVRLRSSDEGRESIYSIFYCVFVIMHAASQIRCLAVSLEIGTIRF